MPYPIVFTPLAKEDVREARDWYDNTSRDVGTAFVTDVLNATNRIASNPLHYAKTYGEVRQMLVKRFTYVIYFRLHHERVEILAVLHAHRDPKIWKRRT